jgi:hypothetical protein
LLAREEKEGTDHQGKSVRINRRSDMGKLQEKVAVITGEKLICSLPVQNSRCVDEPNGS